MGEAGCCGDTRAAVPLRDGESQQIPQRSSQHSWFLGETVLRSEDAVLQLNSRSMSAEVQEQEQGPEDIGTAGNALEVAASGAAAAVACTAVGIAEAI